MFKKFFTALLVFVFVTTLTACDEETKTDADIVREVRDSIVFDSFEITEDIDIPVIDNDEVIVNWVSSNPAVLDINGTVIRPEYYENSQNISLTVSIQLRDALVSKVFNFTVLKAERPALIELNTDETDNLSLDFSYESSNFLADGVGEVVLVRCIDGDTAIFEEDGTSFTVRFLGINTPESTAKFEPWGKTASAFTCDKLSNASTIVLQADPVAGRLDSYGTRYLAWVWYDGRLVNLELVEQAYSKASGSTDTMYGNIIFSVNLMVQYSQRRVWGEVDPDFDYSLEGAQITIEELVTNYEEYKGGKVSITGIVTRAAGEGAVWIQQGDFGIYLYHRSWTPVLYVGNEITLSGLTATEFPDDGTGAIQVSGYQGGDYATVISTGNVFTPKTVLVSEITNLHVGSLLNIEDLTVISIFEGLDSFTITAEDSLGNTFTVRKDGAAPEEILASMFQIGTKFTVVGPLTRYNSNYQLLITSLDDITIE